jgi:hypothetical protein
MEQSTTILNEANAEFNIVVLYCDVLYNLRKHDVMFFISSVLCCPLQST